MDRTAWIAVALCIVGLVFWEYYSVTHPAPAPARPAASPSATASATSTAQPQISSPTPSASVAPKEQPTPTPASFVEKRTTLSNGDLQLLMTNRGGGIAEAVLPKHKAENGGPIRLNAPNDLPIGAIVDKPAAPALNEFAISAEKGSVDFERALGNGVTLHKRFTLAALPKEKDNYIARMEVSFQNRGATAYSQPGYFIALGSAAPVHGNDWTNYTRLTWCIDGKTKTTDVNWFGEQTYPLGLGQRRPAQQFFEQSISNAEWAAVSNQFFCTLVAPLDAKADKAWATRFEVAHQAPGEKPVYGIEGAMGMPGFEVKPGQTTKLNFQLYVGPKLYRRLAQLTHDEAEIMDFGMWKLVSQALLNLMNLIHGFVGNYAVAILILTAIVKAILWPLQTKANKSMRRMAALSPKMQELREKYKDDPTKMNQELMKLYKDYGVNPVSGCLPMMIQIPIFFGLFTMLRQAVELRNASFLWVHDLSQPDTIAHIPGLGWPINILPLIMAATSFWMTHITPKSGDATQQRVMMFMPLIFVVFCYNFAAALALYYTTQNLFTILQLYQNRNQPLPKLEKVTQQAKRRGKAR
jgi:YidC/Oxa1 family membrane protein insertase